MSDKKFVYAKCIICKNDFEVDEERGLGRTLCYDNCVVRSKDIKEFSDYVNNMETVDRNLLMYIEFAINDRVSSVSGMINIINDLEFDERGDWKGIHTYIDGGKKGVKTSKWTENIIREIGILRKSKMTVINILGSEL